MPVEWERFRESFNEGLQAVDDEGLVLWSGVGREADGFGSTETSSSSP